MTELFAKLKKKFDNFRHLFQQNQIAILKKKNSAKFDTYFNEEEHEILQKKVFTEMEYTLFTSFLQKKECSTGVHSPPEAL